MGNRGLSLISKRVICTVLVVGQTLFLFLISQHCLPISESIAVENQNYM